MKYSEQECGIERKVFNFFAGVVARENSACTNFGNSHAKTDETYENVDFCKIYKKDNT
jgi:hypothetical protein